MGKWWEMKIGRAEEEECPKCVEEGLQGNERMGKEQRDSWEALGSKKWVRMEDSGRVDEEGRPILARVDLMEAFFPGVHRRI